MSWTDRVADRSPTVQRSRDRSVAQAQVIVDAARRLIDQKGTSFTINELVREAGVALQTFYRYFEGKDQLQLAVFEDLLADGTAAMKAAAADLSDPVQRLHLYVTSGFTGVDVDTEYSPQFITAEHWRLYQEFPDEMAAATRHFTDLVLAEIRAGLDQGVLRSDDPERDAWMMTNLVMAMFHQSAFASTPLGVETGEQVWAFCRAALGVEPPKRAARRPSSGKRRAAS